MYPHKCNYPVLLLLLKNGELICAINAQTVYLNKLFSKLKLNFYLFIQLVEIKNDEKKKEVFSKPSVVYKISSRRSRSFSSYTYSIHCRFRCKRKIIAIQRCENDMMTVL